MNPSYRFGTMSGCVRCNSKSGNSFFIQGYKANSYDRNGRLGTGARIIESVYANNLKFPLIRYNGYDLPSWVDEKTLNICSSFSGTTEETVSNAKKAIEKKFKWMAIGSGATLIDLAKRENVPYYHIDPVHNPSKQPRTAIGYSVVGQLRLVAAAGLISFEQKEIDSCVARMRSIIEANTRNVSYEKNNCKQFAKLISEKQVIFVGAEHLIGAIHTIKNQMNENAKHLSQIHEIPELNHHLMEGLAFPKSNTRILSFSSLSQIRIRVDSKTVSNNKRCYTEK